MEFYWEKKIQKLPPTRMWLINFWWLWQSSLSNYKPLITPFRFLVSFPSKWNVQITCKRCRGCWYLCLTNTTCETQVSVSIERPPCTQSQTSWRNPPVSTEVFQKWVFSLDPGIQNNIFLCHAADIETKFVEIFTLCQHSSIMSYRVGGHPWGCCILNPCSTWCRTSALVIPGYGIRPNVTSSVSKIPKLQTSDLMENLN